VVDETTGPDEAALAVVARHALHDEELVAALATGSLDDEAEIGRARSFIERCTACRSLHDDVAAIGAALKADARGTIPAPRDFRLSVEDAHKLGGPVSVGGFVTSLRGAIASFGRPVGASMAAVGIVGLLVGSMSLGGGVAAGPLAAGAGPTTASSTPAELQAESSPDRAKATDLTAAFGPGASSDDTQGDSETPHDSASVGMNPLVLLLGGSVLLLLAGIGLLVLAIRRNP
jgi:hypothetical protein